MSGEISHSVFDLAAGEYKVEKPTGRIRHRNRGFQALFSERILVLILGDTVILALATTTSIFLLNLAVSTNEKIISISEHWYWLVLWCVIWLASAQLHDLYDIPTAYAKNLAISRILLTGLLSFAGLMMLTVLVHTPFTFWLLLFISLTVIPTLIAWRFLYIKISKSQTFQHRILILGTGNRAKSLISLLNARPELNFQVMGCVSENSRSFDSGLGEINVLGQTMDLPRLIEKFNVHEIVLALDHGISQELSRYLIDCQANGASLTYMPDLYARIQRQVPIEDLDPEWALHALQSQALCWRLKLAIKRLLDLILLVFGLPVLGLLLPILALAIRLDSPGPIFYRQCRCGRAGKPFHILKFRTMVSDAEKEGKPQWAKQDDSRITKLGLFLRKSHLDELPQQINVLLGDMSFIGPRPERPEFVEVLSKQVPFFDARMTVKPGITGWAQVHYRYGNCEEDALVKLKYDFFYIHHWSIWMDLYILFRTPIMMIKLRGT